MKKSKAHRHRTSPLSSLVGVDSTDLWMSCCPFHYCMDLFDVFLCLFICLPTNIILICFIISFIIVVVIIAVAVY